MNIEGYHGTLASSTKAILDSKHFNKSCGPKEWLGFGIYFFKDSSLAKIYAQKKCEKEYKKVGKCQCETSPCSSADSPGIIAAQIECEDKDCYNLDDDDDLKRIEGPCSDFIFQYHEAQRKTINGSMTEMRCALLEVIGAKLGAKVFIKNFPLHKGWTPLFFEIRVYETYICVRDESILKELKREEVVCERRALYAI